MRYLLVLVGVFLSFSLVFADTNEKQDFYKAVVLEVLEKKSEDKELNEFIPAEEKKIQFVKVKILSGKKRNKVLEISHLPISASHNFFLKKGDLVTVYQKNQEYFINGYWYLDSLIFWCFLFLFVVLLLGKKKGLTAILPLISSLFLILWWFIPSVFQGGNPLLLTVLLTIILNLITLPFILGFNRKFLVSFLGTSAGVLISILVIFLIDYFNNFNGLGTEDMRLLAVNNPNLDFSGIFFSGILIGAVGALMDTSVSISSGVMEISKNNPKISKKQLLVSGLNIGRDILGSMINTLIFAYVGSSISLLLIIKQNNVSFLEFFNYSFVAEEIIRSLVGSFGIIATIPLTALFASYFFQFKKN
jgi:uncharacterized membrane protein